MLRATLKLATPLTLALITALPPTPATAQDCPEGDFPEGWEARFDREGTSMDALCLVVMLPGLHITTGPALIAYHPRFGRIGRLPDRVRDLPLRSRGAARGLRLLHRRRRSAGAGPALHLFSPARRRPVPGQVPAGMATLWSRTGPRTRRSCRTPRNRRKPALRKTSSPWKPTATNCASTSTTSRSGRGPRGDLATDGIFGMRVNHRLNLHVTTIMSGELPD